MELQDAFSAVEHLAACNRLLVGHGCRRWKSGRHEASLVDWEAGDIRDNGTLSTPQARSHIAPDLMERFKSQGLPQTWVLVTRCSPEVIVVVLGAESVDQVRESLCAGDSGLVSQAVQECRPARVLRRNGSCRKMS